MMMNYLVRLMLISLACVFCSWNCAADGAWYDLNQNNNGQWVGAAGGDGVVTTDAAYKVSDVTRWNSSAFNRGLFDTEVYRPSFSCDFAFYDDAVLNDDSSTTLDEDENSTGNVDTPLYGLSSCFAFLLLVYVTLLFVKRRRHISA